MSRIRLSDLWNAAKQTFSDPISSWHAGVENLQHSDSALLQYAGGYSSGVMGTLSNQAAAIGQFISDPKETISQGIENFKADPLRNNPIYGVYSFYDNLATAGANGDWFAAGQGLGTAGTVCTQMVLGAAVGDAIKNTITARNGVVIGQGMDRVRTASNVANAPVYQPMRGYNLISRLSPHLAEKLSLAHNRTFIERVMRVGGPIYDNGPDIGFTSKYYAMERAVTEGYSNIIRMW
ncbi:MAG: hypothetical protein LBD23_09865 [Oscillospiraceae bacterium]|nr:hypothetical protein [Oscillospiraceae bacterium]